MSRILVIDDDLFILEAVGMMLEDAGYEIDLSSKSGDHIEHAIERHPPDLILLDVLLSKHDGLKMCEKLKDGEATRHIPIIMISAHPNAEVSAFKAGADDFLEKPFDIDVLLAKMQQFLA